MEDKSTQIICVIENTSGNPYGKFTDKVISIIQEENVVILTSKELKQLEKVIGAKFKV